MKKESLKQTIQQGFAGLFHICKQELKAVFKDQGVLIFFLLVPLAYPLVYAFIYTNEVVREVPVAVIDNNTRHSAASLSVRLMQVPMCISSRIVRIWKKGKTC